ncbi:MAG: flagellar filament capping protein FliD [Lachnospiraceae bacterium]|nr:flagellar filament capping protein FliD [Lachnospiraceae bacterium]
MSIRISGMASGMDTDAMVQDLVSAYRTKGDTYVKTQKRAELKQEKWKDLNKKIKSFNNKYAANMQYSSYYSSKKTTVSDSSKATVVAADNAVNNNQSLEVTQLAKTAYLTGAKVADGTTSSTTLGELMGGGSDWSSESVSVNGQSFDISSDMTVGEFVSTLKSAGLNASFDEDNQRLFVSAKESGVSNDFSFDTTGSNASAALEALGLTSEDAVKIDGQDAKIKLNGAEFTNSSNTFSINGLTITAKGETTDPVTISTETDYDAIYDKVKNFIKDYNSLINEMTELYNAPANSGYDPLTDEEKEALTESEIEKWEEKVNESLLRRDSNLSQVSSVLREAMAQTFDYEGKTYSLSSFGIGTLSYFTASEDERNAYHIDGDEDDENTASNSDKLKAAIAADPEAVTSFFSKLAQNMYTKLSDISKSTSMRSFGNFYDDKQMKTDITKYETKVSDWEDYVKEIEDKYYKQFARMESAMTTLNSQQSYISGMFGVG